MPKSMRWAIAGMVGCAIAISYFDRQTLSLAVTSIAKQIPISNTRFSALQSAFLLSYAFMYAAGGRLVDVLGTRRGLMLIMIVWSLASASHGLAVNFGMLMMSRLLLGMGEGGGFPAATKLVAEWFPAAERSLAMGIINSGTAVGAVAAPPIVAAILLHFHWRWVFAFSGLCGLVWAQWWWQKYLPPALQPRLSSEERRIVETIAADNKQQERESTSWVSLLARPEVIGLVAAKFLTDAAWFFYLFWLPKYLYDARGFNIKEVGLFAWIPYAAAGLGCLVGGWFSGRLIRSGFTLNAARKAALGASAACMPPILLVTHVPIPLALAIFSLAFFGQQSWSTLVMIVPADLFPSGIVASVAGLVGFGGAMGGVVFGSLAGYLLDHGFSYSQIFAAVSTFHVFAFLCILFSVRVIRPLAIGPKLAEIASQ